MEGAGDVLSGRALARHVAGPGFDLQGRHRSRGGDRKNKVLKKELKKNTVLVFFLRNERVTGTPDSFV